MEKKSNKKLIIILLSIIIFLVGIFCILLATGTSQIIGIALVTTSVINSVLTVRNPVDNAAALTITPVVGGTEPVSAHLVILQIQ